jgi:long-chain acyl-CoA synthetase
MIFEVSVTPAAATSGHPSRLDATSTGSYGRVTAWLSKQVEVALAQRDLTLPQYRVLGILAEGSAAASPLADRLAVRPSSITAIIDGLVARGFVDRRHEEDDRRRIALRLTPEGARCVADADRLVDEHMTSIAAWLPPEDEALALHSLVLWGKALANRYQSRKKTS